MRPQGAICFILSGLTVPLTLSWRRSRRHSLVSRKFQNVDVAIAAIGEVGKSFNSRADAFDRAAMVSPLHDNLVADAAGFNIQAAERKKLAKKAHPSDVIKTEEQIDKTVDPSGEVK